MNDSSLIALQGEDGAVSSPTWQQTRMASRVEQESQKKDEPRTTGSKGKVPYVS